MWNTILEILKDAWEDSFLLLPFLFVSYILIELIEHKTVFEKVHKGLNGKCAPLVGGAMGLVPQCGFSVMAAKLYEHRHLTLGALLSVFIATSDEAFLILLSPESFAQGKAIYVIFMLAIKFVIGTGCGFLLDLFSKKHHHHHEIKPLPEDGEGHYCGHDHECEDAEECDKHDCVSCGREHEGKHWAYVYLLIPFLHTLQIFAYIFVINAAFSALFTFVGEEAVVAFLHGGLWVQPLICTLIGLIPNCASSVILTQTFIEGGIAFGSCIGGLCANAGVGLFLLFKNTKEWKRNLLIVGLLYAIGIVVGYAVNAIMLLF